MIIDPAVINYSGKDAILYTVMISTCSVVHEKYNAQNKAIERERPRAVHTGTGLNAGV